MNVAIDKNPLYELVSSLTTFLSELLERLFGPDIHNPVIGSITWVDLAVASSFVLATLIANGLAAWFFRKKIRRLDDSKHSHAQFFAAISQPLYLLLWTGGIYLSVTPLLLKLPSNDALQTGQRIFDKLFDAGIFLALFWVCFRLTRVVEERLRLWAAKTPGKLDDLFVPLIGRSLRVILPVIGIIFALPLIGLPASYAAVLGKGSSILIICVIAWILFQAVNLGEKIVLAEYDIQASDNLRARKIYTQAHLIGRTIHIAISIFTVASILMLFDEVRRLGTSLLASAGIVGIVAGLAAQKTLANLFAGFQIAMAQPMRLDDVVIVEGEWGRIEEITLTYVVVHIWDDRRLILPLSYFIEKPFQNWTRVSAQLLGSVFVWVDYSLPMDEARQALKEIIENHPLWDKRFWNLQVSDATEKTMQLRILATTADASKGWDLRCAIREQFIGYIQKNHPQSLPRVRAEFETRENKIAAEKPSL